jgi:hypothetical protein
MSCLTAGFIVRRQKEESTMKSLKAAFVAGSWFALSIAYAQPDLSAGPEGQAQAQGWQSVAVSADGTQLPGGAECVGPRSFCNIYAGS